MPHLARILALPALAALTLAAGPSAAGRTQQRTIPIRLTEFSIEMPDTVQQGRVDLAITNAGTTEHQIAIRGHREMRATRRLKPGETVTLPIRLVVGEYQAWCMVRNGGQNHRALGMDRTVRVVW
jgi:hypothetical protein